MAFDTTPGEQLTRFVFDSGHLRSGAPRIKFNAFMPPDSGRLSVYWISGLAEPEVWNICAAHVTPIKGKPVRLRGDFSSLHVYASRLQVEVDGIPHKRHANIVGWDTESTKRRLQALKLSESAEPVEPVEPVESA